MTPEEKKEHLRRLRGIEPGCFSVSDMVWMFDELEHAFSIQQVDAQEARRFRALAAWYRRRVDRRDVAIKALSVIGEGNEAITQAPLRVREAVAFIKAGDAADPLAVVR